MGHIVDPAPIIDQRLAEIDEEFRPKLAAARAVAEIVSGRERREARARLRTVKRERRHQIRLARRMRSAMW